MGARSATRNSDGDDRRRLGGHSGGASGTTMARGRRRGHVGSRRRRRRGGVGHVLQGFQFGQLGLPVIDARRRDLLSGDAGAEIERIGRPVARPLALAGGEVSRSIGADVAKCCRRSNCPEVAGSAIEPTAMSAIRLSSTHVVGDDVVYSVPQQDSGGAVLTGSSFVSAHGAVPLVGRAGRRAAAPRGTGRGRCRRVVVPHTIALDRVAQPPEMRMPLPIARIASSIAGVSPWLLEYTMLPTIVVSRCG